MNETSAGISIETLFHFVNSVILFFTSINQEYILSRFFFLANYSWSDNTVKNFSWQKPLPLVTIKVLAFFPLALSIYVKRRDSINVNANVGRAMIGRVKTFSLSSITGLSWDM
jgi:hypothetical protein